VVTLIKYWPWRYIWLSLIARSLSLSQRKTSGLIRGDMPVGPFKYGSKQVNAKQGSFILLSCPL